MKFKAIILLLIIVDDVLSTKKDIIFLVDRSNSISSSQFTHTLSFLHNVTNYLQIGRQGIQVSVILFDKTTEAVFDFDTHLTKQSLLHAIDNIPTHTGTSTDTDVALNYSLSLFTAQNGSRSDADKYVVVLTDGDSDDRLSTKHAADRLRRNNVTVIGMAFGSYASKDQIIELAGGSSNVVTVSDFVYLCNKVPSLVARLDSSVVNRSVNGCPPEPTTTPRSTNVSTVVQKKIHKGGSHVGAIIGATSAVCLLFLLLLLLFLLRKRLRRKTEAVDNDVITGTAPRKTGW